MKRPEVALTALTITKTTAVLTADTLPPTEVRVIWDRQRKFSGQEELEEVLEKAEEKGETIPTDSQIITQDPRLCQTAASFKDAIRRVYNCQRLGVDIHSLNPTYYSQALGQTMTKDRFIVILASSE
jgi:DNA invertase Pin-like site-specific DNA recombinase